MAGVLNTNIISKNPKLLKHESLEALKALPRLATINLKLLFDTRDTEDNIYSVSDLLGTNFRENF
jgi:hypothetical protein